MQRGESEPIEGVGILADDPGEAPPTGKRLATLMLGCLGIVYGDIGTSPLYAFRECLGGAHGIPPSHENVLGVLSLIFWSLVLVLCVKYLGVILRADNRGEGGILALMSLIRTRLPRAAARRPALVVIGLFGAALLYGDGMITPAISVLSAVEGLSIVTPALAPDVVPITIGILLLLFLVQSRGTSRIGALFGPVTLVWFLCIAILGLLAIRREPATLAAIGPGHALGFLVANGWHGFAVLGSVFLVITGAEALYADMGHFGRRPIRLTWFVLVFPCLLLNYFGQGSLLLAEPVAVANPFFRLVPGWLLLPMIGLATLATVIASQAVISGAFSLTRQAVQLGYFPRVRVLHTSPEEIGQIYVPVINWLLLLASVGLVLGFGSSSGLADAYGVAVTTTMAITTVLAFVVMRQRWGWSLAAALPLVAGFLVVDLAFMGSNALKIVHGGWFPLAIGVLGYVVLSTWRRGRELLGVRLQEISIPYPDLLARIAEAPPAEVGGTAIYLTSSIKDVPPMILHNLRHNKVLHERVILLTILTEAVPRIPRVKRVEVDTLSAAATGEAAAMEDRAGTGVDGGGETPALVEGERFYRVIARYGYMQQPDVPDILDRCSAYGLDIDPGESTFFLGRETLLATERPGMPLWREKLFAWFARNEVGATSAFGIPPERVVELGAQIEL